MILIDGPRMQSAKFGGLNDIPEGRRVTARRWKVPSETLHAEPAGICRKRAATGGANRASFEGAKMGISLSNTRKRFVLAVTPRDVG